MQELPGAPGTARQGRTGTSVPATRGGVATQPRAPGHGRPPAAQRAAGHGRLSAASKAPGYDVPLAITTRAPGHDCLSAALRAPGHERPLAAPRAVDYHWSGARHPQVPGQGRFPTAQRAARHGRLSAASPATGHDVPLAVTAGAPGHDCLSATPIATAALPAHVSRLLQVTLPRVPATPNTLTYPHPHRLNRHSRESGNPRPPVAFGGTTGGLRTGNLRCVLPNPHPPTIPPSHPPSASCYPGTAPPAALLHRGHRLPPPAPRPRPAASSLRRKPQSSPPSRHSRESGNPLPLYMVERGPGGRGRGLGPSALTLPPPPPRATGPSAARAHTCSSPTTA